MLACLEKNTAIPQWYLAVHRAEIIGGVGVIENDFHDRKDLSPNLCALFVEEAWRNQGIAGKLLQFVCDDMEEWNIHTLYLLTEHTSFYERYDWEYICTAKTGESAAETAQVEGSETAETDNAELEGEYAEISVNEPVIIEANAGAEAPPLSFSAETDQLLWPIAGNILMDFSMDKTVYFSTLDQYKYNPAIIIEGSVDQSVLSAASGKVISIENVDETGTTITMDIGSGYQVIYGQIKEPAVQQGDYVQAGALIGYVAEPTRFYSKEGSNLYFQVLKDGESINPKELLP